ncbi:hypothetical protein GC207_09200 [bacterium]|nr:hypothetical protein [bacterium]
MFVLAVVGAITTFVFRAGWGHPHNTITLPDGTTVRLLTITVGTRHVYGSLFARTVEKLPGSTGNFLRNRWPDATRVHWFDSREQQLVAWLEYNRPPARPDWIPLLASADGHKIEAASYGVMRFTTNSSSVVVQAYYPTWPRRGKNLECVFQQKMGKERPVQLGSFRFANPAPVAESVPSWKPIQLPATKIAVDLKVTLESFRSGISESEWLDMARLQYAPFGISSTFYDLPGAAFQIVIHSTNGQSEAWKIAGVELTNATGNHLSRFKRLTIEGDSAFIRPVLWADESAWELKLTLKRGAAADRKDFRTVAFRVDPNWQTNKTAPDGN